MNAGRKASGSASSSRSTSTVIGTNASACGVGRCRKPLHPGLPTTWVNVRSPFSSASALARTSTAGNAACSSEANAGSGS